MKKIAFDTNVLVYSADNDSAKCEMARKLLQYPTDMVVSAQVVSELIHVLQRKHKLVKKKIDIFRESKDILSYCSIQAVDFSTLDIAEHLIERYDFQSLDAIIVASALEANCDVLFSEDMQSGLLVEDRLRIVNPFL